MTIVRTHRSLPRFLLPVLIAVGALVAVPAAAVGAVHPVSAGSATHFSMPLLASGQANPDNTVWG